MYGCELDCEEGWALKNWCFWTVVLEKTLESPLDCKEIQPVHPKGDQSWVFFGRNNVEAETPVLRPPDVKSWLIWKDPDAGKDCGKEEKGTTEDEIGWMISPTQWTWVWVDSRSWWWTGRPGMPQFMGSQSRTRLSNWTELNWIPHCINIPHQIQLTLEQHWFELCRSTYTWNFFKKYATVIHDPKLVESVNGEPLIWSAVCSYMWIFNCATHALFKGQLYVYIN